MHSQPQQSMSLAWLAPRAEKSTQEWQTRYTVASRMEVVLKGRGGAVETIVLKKEA